MISYWEDQGPKKKRFERLSSVKLDENGCEKQLSDYKELVELGKGSFATVIKVEELATRKVYAMKKISKQTITIYKKTKYVQLELDLMYQLKNQNIIELVTHFEDEQYIYLIQELASRGTLHDLLTKNKKIKELECKKYMKQIVEGIQYAHNQGIIHRDIKPENIFIDENWNMKIGDFGAGNQLTEENQFRNSLVGTSIYMAPEIINKEQYGTSVDVWSLGVLVYELLTGILPFGNSESEAQELEIIQDNIVQRELEFPDAFPALAKSLVQGMLRKDPAQRLNLDQVLEHIWIRDQKCGEGPKDVSESKYSWLFECLEGADENQVEDFEGRMLRFKEALDRLLSGGQSSEIQEIKRLIREKEEEIRGRLVRKTQLEQENRHMIAYLIKRNQEIQQQQVLEGQQAAEEGPSPRIVLNPLKAQSVRADLEKLENFRLQLLQRIEGAKFERAKKQLEIQNLSAKGEKSLAMSSAIQKLEAEVQEHEQALASWDKRLEELQPPAGSTNSLKSEDMNDSMLLSGYRRTTFLEQIESSMANSLLLQQRLEEQLNRLRSNLESKDRLERLIGEDRNYQQFALQKQSEAAQSELSRLVQRGSLINEQLRLSVVFHEENEKSQQKILALEREYQECLETEKKTALIEYSIQNIKDQIQNMAYLKEQLDAQITSSKDLCAKFKQEHKKLLDENLQFNENRKMWIAQQGKKSKN